MKRIVYLILVFSTLTSCQTKKYEHTDKSKDGPIDLGEYKNGPGDLSTPEKEYSIFIKDSSDYSTNFLKELEKSGMSNVSLVDSFLILSPADTVVFPQFLQIGEKTILTAKKNKLAIALTIERINQTTIDYKVEMVEFGNISYNFKGQADLNPRFNFEPETDESSLSGISYSSTEYRNSQDSCQTIIRLGREKDSGPYLLGKIIKNCNGKIQDIELGNFPTLIEK